MTGLSSGHLLYRGVIWNCLVYTFLVVKIVLDLNLSLRKLGYLNL